MIVHQVFAIVYEKFVQNIIVCDNYELANQIARGTMVMKLSQQIAYNILVLQVVNIKMVSFMTQKIMKLPMSQHKNSKWQLYKE